MRGRSILGTAVIVWLLIGVLAVWQRGYFSIHDDSCQVFATIAVTVVAGPLNYAGVKPEVGSCHLPQPSSMPAAGVDYPIGVQAA